MVALRNATILLALVVLMACERPGLNIASVCELNTDCAEPLVCALERCRRQCVDSRDCAAGLFCLQNPDHGGICQIPEEASCILTSDCTRGLACRFGTCTTECATDRDCPPMSSCRRDPAGDDLLVCIEALPEACIYNSDCPEGLVCAADRTCRYECIRDEDCDPLRYCASDYRCYPLDLDAGL